MSNVNSKKSHQFSWRAFSHLELSITWNYANKNIQSQPTRHCCVREGMQTLSHGCKLFIIQQSVMKLFFPALLFLLISHMSLTWWRTRTSLSQQSQHPDHPNRVRHWGVYLRVTLWNMLINLTITTWDMRERNENLCTDCKMAQKRYRQNLTVNYAISSREEVFQHSLMKSESLRNDYTGSFSIWRTGLELIQDQFALLTNKIDACTKRAECNLEEASECPFKLQISHCAQ